MKQMIIIPGAEKAILLNKPLAIILETIQLAPCSPMVNTLKLCIAEAIRQKLTKRFKGTFRVNFGLDDGSLHVGNILYRATIIP